MTTIAYKDGILAADTQLTFTGDTKGTCHKITILSDGRVYASAGDSTADWWWEKYLNGEKVPIKEHKRFKKIEGILLDGDKAYWYNGGLELVEIHEKFYACGSGFRIARAGMHMGLSPKDAVKLAGNIDIYTNTIVDVYDTKRKKISYGK